MKEPSMLGEVGNEQVEQLRLEWQVGDSIWSWSSNSTAH